MIPSRCSTSRMTRRRNTPAASAPETLVALVFSLALLALAALPARADVILLKTGDQILGLAQDVPGDETRVRLITAAGEIELPRTRVSQITKEAPSTGWRRIAEEHIKNEHLSEAAAALDRAASLTPVDPDVEKVREALGRKMAQAARASEQQTRSTQVQALDDVEALLAQGGFEDTAAEKRFEEAKRKLDSVGEARNKDLEPRRRRLAGALYLAWAAFRRNKLDNLGAAGYYQEALRYDPQNKAARDALLDLWFDDPARTDDVARGYEARLRESPDDVLLMRKLSELYIRQKRLEQALPLLSRIQKSAKGQDATLNRTLFETYIQLSNEAARANDLDKAIRLYKDLLDVFPSADIAPLRFLEYLQRRDELKPDDYNGLADLAAFLKQNGLDSQARNDIDQILSKDPHNAKALGLLRDYALADLKDIEDSMKIGQYSLAMSQAEQMIELYPRLADIVEKADALRTKSEIEFKRQQQAIRAQAQELIAIGDGYRNEAYNNANQMQISDRKENVRVINYRLEAIKYCKRGLAAYREALRLDSSLGSITSADLNNKMQDLRQLYGALTAPPVPLPRLSEKITTKN